MLLPLAIHAHTAKAQAMREACRKPEIKAISIGLRAACKAAGARITGDDRINEATVAMLIGRRPKTLANWRHTHRPILFIEQCRRISYRIPDIAKWVHESCTEPE